MSGNDFPSHWFFHPHQAPNPPAPLKIIFAQLAASVISSLRKSNEKFSLISSKTKRFAYHLNTIAVPIAVATRVSWATPISAVDLKIIWKTLIPEKPWKLRCGHLEQSIADSSIAVLTSDSCVFTTFSCCQTNPCQTKSGWRRQPILSFQKTYSFVDLRACWADEAL
jgi:hypothetical protein